MILIELLVVTTVVSIVLVTLNFMRKRRDRAAASRLIQKIKEDVARRKEETKKLMQHKFGFEQDVAEEIAIKSGREERKFYQNVINCYLRREAMSFENLNIDFEGAVDPYRTLEPPGLGGESAGDVELVNESEEIRRLKIENQRLSDEVGVTMQTMSRMLDEYSSMFAGGTTDDLDKEKMLKQLQGGTDEAAGEAAAEAKPELDDEVSAEPESAVEEEPIAEAEAGVEGNLTAESEADVNEGSIGEAEQTSVDPGEIAVEESQEEISSMVEEMDDLSDLDKKEHEDLSGEDGLENPDELIG